MQNYFRFFVYFDTYRIENDLGKRFLIFNNLNRCVIPCVLKLKLVFIYFYFTNFQPLLYFAPFNK